MKTKSKPAAPPAPSKFDRWRARVMAYCHECWGRGGFEGLTDKAWRRFWDSEVRPDLSEWEFAACVVLPWCAHHAMNKGTDALRRPAEFATRKAVKAVRRGWAECEARYKALFDVARTAAARTAVPPLPPDPPAPEDAGRWEQPPRDRGKLRVVHAAAGPSPVPLAGVRFKDLVAWAEAVTDEFERRGEFPTVFCLTQLAHAAGCADRDECVLAARRLAALYHAEFEREPQQARRLVAHAAAADAPKPESKKEERPAKPPPKVEARSAAATVTGEGDQKRYAVYGHPVTAVLRWMGKAGWALAEARAVLDRLGLMDVKENTLKAQLMTGRKGDGAFGRKPAAALTPEQSTALHALLEEDNGEEAAQQHQGRPGERPGREGGRPGEARRQTQAQPVPHDGKARRGADTKSKSAGTGEGRRPGVRPPDEPARLRGRAGGAAPGPAGGKGGVGRQPAKKERPDVRGGGGKGRGNDRPAVGRGDAAGAEQGRRGPGPGVNGKGPRPGKAPGNASGTRLRAGKPPGKGKPARTR